MPTQRDLDMLRALPLELKIEKTKARIREWYHAHNGQVYVSFSGGKDSTVLLHLVRSEFPDVVAVFSDTGLEYPEIKEFIKTVPNVEWLKPKMSFLQVIEKYGYPVISKNIARYIRDLKNPTEKNIKTREYRLTGIRKDGSKGTVGVLSEKWKPLINSSFKISEQCCDIMKKNPLKHFTKYNNKYPIIGTMTEESSQRKINWIRFGCNAFNRNNISSQPLSFWNEQDILKYIQINNLKIAEVYGNIVEVDNKLTLTGVNRTGCVFCMFGYFNEEEDDNRFTKLKKTHPMLYNYVIEKLKIGNIINEVNKLCGTNMKY